MSIAIIYMTRHGCTEKAAEMLRDMHWGKVDLINLGNSPNPDISGYDTVIIGGSIHMGEIQGKIKDFCETNENLMLAKRLGLYICHLDQGEAAVRQFNITFSQKLRDHAVAKGLFGGELNFEKMSECDRVMVRKVTGIDKTISALNTEAIKGFGRVIFHLDKS